MTRIEFTPGKDWPTEPPEVRVVGVLRGAVLDPVLEMGAPPTVLDLTGVCEVDAAALHTLALLQPGGPPRVISPGWLALLVERERARLALDALSC